MTKYATCLELQAHALKTPGICLENFRHMPRKLQARASKTPCLKNSTPGTCLENSRHNYSAE